MSTPESLQQGRDGGRFEFELAVASLDFKPYKTKDPVPLGLQFVEIAGLRPEAHKLVAILPSRDFEEVRKKEPFDLRERGVERFIAFETDRLFAVEADGAELLWGAASIPADVLYGLIDPGKDQALFLDVPGGQDLLLEPGSSLDLSANTTEKVIVGPKPVRGFDIVAVYNGQPKSLRVRKNELLQRVLEAALAAFGGPGGDLILVGLDGAELPLDRTVGDVGLQPGAQVLLRPRVVRGG